MTIATDQRLQMLERMAEAEYDLAETKGVEYAGRDDVLANFRRSAERLDLHMEQTWAVLFTKHVDAILSYCADPDVTRQLSEPIDGRILDCRVYLGLLQLMVEERRAQAQPLGIAMNDAREGEPVQIGSLKEFEEVFGGAPAPRLCPCCNLTLDTGQRVRAWGRDIFTHADCEPPRDIDCIR